MRAVYSCLPLTICLALRKQPVGLGGEVCARALSLSHVQLSL